jgi:1-acyl-sn-glycerol-3-phosphate acyltransferase
MAWQLIRIIIKMFIINWLTSTCFWVSFVIGVIFIEYALMKTKAVRNVNEERDSKYPSFRRTDVKKWSRLRFYAMAPLLPWRMLGAIVCLVSLLVVSKILFIFNHG